MSNETVKGLCPICGVVGFVATPPAPVSTEKSRLKVGDVVRLTEGRDAGKTATVGEKHGGRVRLNQPLGDYCYWNEWHLELAAPDSTEQSETRVLATRLRELACGTVEWHIKHPASNGYCAVFRGPDNGRPERKAREWLANHRTRFPRSGIADYVAVRVHSYSALEQAAIDAAEKLERIAGDKP